MKKYIVEAYKLRTVISLVETEVQAKNEEDAYDQALENIEIGEFSVITDREELEESCKIHTIEECSDSEESSEGL